MKISRQEKLKTYLTSTKRKQFRNINNQLFVYDNESKEWLQYIYTNKEFKPSTKYFSKYKLEKEIFEFLCKNYNNENITSTEVRALIKLIPNEIK